MKYEFSQESLDRLSSVHDDLVRIAFALIEEMDVSIICGHRNEISQNSAFINGKSKLQWPRSKHNRMPSEAVDIAPYCAKIRGIDWDDIPAFMLMCDKIERIAKELGVKIKLGRDFDWVDLPHIELSPKNKN